MLSREMKKAFIEALEKDKEFRYTVMGLLGFKELLERFSKLEERQQKLEERQQRLEERFARLEERFAKLEKRQQRLEERQQKLEERVSRVLEELRDLRRVVTVIAHRFGVISEEAFREGMKSVVEEILGVAKVDKWVYYDENGEVYGYPSIIEVDTVVYNDKHILIEVKSRVSKGDVAELYRKGILYERVKKVKPSLVIIGGMIDKDSYEAAKKLGVSIKPIVSST